MHFLKTAFRDIIQFCRYLKVELSRLRVIFFFLRENTGCYYQYQHYAEGQQILTSEPCLNCTCRNSVLMCYLKVCPFIKPVGKNCKVEKREGECCPTIRCPQGK